ncbi:MAG TPA: hypothetical protein VK963_02330 [Candidatus Saccharimonadales bacterium]|nr:hypothetical protein [Candidatus Saccharimonadales bacterium]
MTFAGTDPIDRDAVLAVLKEAAIEALGVKADEVTEDARLRQDSTNPEAKHLDPGGVADDIDLAEFFELLEEHFGLAISDQEYVAMALGTVGQTVDYILSRQQPRGD